jgi:hypothetical protein
LKLNEIILLLFVCLFSSFKISAQTYNYTYTDPCTGNDQTIIVPINGNVTVGYYGAIGSFSYNDFSNGTFESWASNIFTQYGTNSPCSEIVGLGTAVNVTQSTALNVIGILNSLSTISDIAGSTNILGGSVNSVSNAGNGGGSGKKENKRNNSSESSNNTQTQGNGSQNPNNNTGSQQTGGQNTTAGSTNGGPGSQQTGGQNTTAGSTNGGSGSQETGGQNTTPGSTSGGEGNSTTPNNPQGSGNNGNNSTGNTQSGQQNTNGGGTSEQSQGTGNTNQQGEQQSNQGSTEQGQQNNQTTENGETSNNNPNGNTGNTGNSGSGTGNGGSNEQTQEGQPQPDPKEEEGGQTNITAGASTTVKSTPTSKEGGKPTVVASADFVGFNFRNSEVTTGVKATGGYTAMRWDGKRSYGAMADYTSALKGPNITAFYAWIRPKSIVLTSGTLTIGFEGNKSLYGTFAAGQMFNITKPKNLKLLYMATVSYGSVYRESFLGTALIAGGTYDFRIGKRFDIKLMNLMVYAPYVSYYNDVVLKSPYVMLPSIGTNIKITKKFKFNINAGGAWDLKTSALNYTVTCGTRLVVGQ